MPRTFWINVYHDTLRGDQFSARMAYPINAKRFNETSLYIKIVYRIKVTLK